MAKRHGVSAETVYGRRRKFGVMDVDDATRLKSFEAENPKLKKVLADRMLEIGVLKEINAKKRLARPVVADRSAARNPGVCR